MEFLLLLEGDSHYRLSAFGTVDGWIGVGLVDMNGPSEFSSAFHLHSRYNLGVR